MDNTDVQDLTSASIDASNILTIAIENGAAVTVDLSSYLDNTDAQTIALNNTTNILTLGNGTAADTTVDLSGYVSTDDQNLTSATIDGSNILTIAIENGDPVTVDLSAYLDNTDVQDLTITGNILSLTGDATSVTLPTADGTETVVTAGTDISVTGDGSVATPYVIANTRPDIFYPPSIEVDVATTGTGRTIDLHAEYLAQYGTPAVVSTGAPVAIPTYANNELYYYVTYYDPTVFANVSVDAVGEMTYDVIATPTDYNTLINVVFVAQ